jgi:uroporphyrinogen-III decarboxylase
MSPDLWLKYYKPQLKRICDVCHQYGVKTIYHGCGDARAIYDDLIEAGVDCYNPLEAKAHLDVVELKKQYKDRWSFNGNINVQVLETNDREKIRKEVLRKLNAAKGGGYIFQSDHSMPNNVDPQTYDYIIQLVREYGNYPLNLETAED